MEGDDEMLTITAFFGQGKAGSSGGQSDDEDGDGDEAHIAEVEPNVVE